METRRFPTAVIASLATGTILCKFSDMYVAAEFLMGQPIGKHHFADKSISDAIKRKILEQCPEMPTEIAGVSNENYLEKVADIESVLGRTVTIRRGDSGTAVPPFAGLPDDKPIIAIRSDKRSSQDGAES